MNELTTERELKLAVPSEAILERLEADFGEVDRVLEQHNTFFDYEHRLTNARWSLRLRIQNGAGLLNLKGPKTSGDDLLVSRPETPDVPVADDVVEALLASNADPIGYLDEGLAAHGARAYVTTARGLLDGGRATPFADFRNERRTFLIERAGLQFEIEADRTDYGSHGRFFEIEVELPNEGTEAQHEAFRRWLESRFTSLDIPIVGAPSKQHRLLSFMKA